MMITRRDTLAAAAGITCATAVAAQDRTSGPAGPQAALEAFLRAFEDCDLARMESAFAPDATYFDRAPRTPGDPAQYRRGRGMPPGMKQLASTLPGTVAGPPYHRVEPHNLTSDLHGDTALITFELDSPESLGRRTILLRQEANEWKIVHLHASNVYR